MKKVNGFRKALALLLSVLIAIPMLGLSAFAEDPAATFTRVWTYSNIVDPGEYWYNCRALATATGTEVYRYDAEFYLSADANTLKITYTQDSEPVTELRTRDADAAYFDYLYVLPEMNQLPTSPDGLADGAYWFDKEGYVNYATLHTQEQYLYMYTTADFFLSVDGTILRKAYYYTSGTYTSTSPSYSDEFVQDDPGTMCYFLRQAGVDPNAGFTLLPKSDEGLEVGDYWFDAATLAADYGSSGTEYLNSEYYLSDDGNTLRRIKPDGMHTDYSIYQGSMMSYYLHQYGVDPNAGFNLLPTSAEGLSDGDYWFDVETLVAAAGEYGFIYRGAEFYLSDDGETLRMILGGSPTDSKRSEGGYLFAYLRQVGVDPNAGFTLLPKSADGLQNGDYWYDAASLAAVAGEYASLYQNADYYLSDDAQTLRIILSGAKLDFKSTDDGASTFFAYLRQVADDPYAGYTKLTTYTSSLRTGDRWYNSYALANATDFYSYRYATYYISDDENTLMIEYSSGTETKTELHTRDEEPVYFACLQVFPAFGDALPTSEEGLEDGAYWFDKAGLVDAMREMGEDENYMYLYTDADYYLSVDGAILRQTYMSGSTALNTDELVADNPSIMCYFLRQAGVDPNAGFNLLPTSPDGLDDGDYWYDAAGLAAMLEEEEFADMAFYLSEDGNTLRFIYNYSRIDIESDSEEGAIFFAFLYQVGVDPNAGFEPVYFSEADAYCRGYVFDLDGYIDMSIEEENEYRVKQGQEPMTPEEEAKERADLLEEIRGYTISINPDEEKIRIAAEGQQIVFGSTTEFYAQIIPFITPFTSDNHEWGEWTAADGVETRTCARCGATESRAIAGDKVLWAGYEEYNGVKTDDTVYVIAKAGASKVQLRYAMGTVSYTRKNANAAISAVTYGGYDCELWTISRELPAGDYVAVAKYGSTLLADIPDADGVAFSVADQTQEPEIEANVYSAAIDGVDENNSVAFDGKTAQTITVTTGTDVLKVQLQGSDGKSFTYNNKNAVVTEGTTEGGAACLVWTITRVFTQGDYDFTINVRTQANGLEDSGMKLAFTVA